MTRRHLAQPITVSEPSLESSPYLTLRELVVYLRYASRQSAHNFVVRNNLRRLWRGRCVLVRRADVDAVIEGRKRTDGKAA